MTISNEKNTDEKDINLCFQIGTEVVDYDYEKSEPIEDFVTNYFSVSLDEEELKRIIEELRIKYGEQEMAYFGYTPKDVVVTKKCVRKDSTFPSGTLIVEENHIICEYERTELPPIVTNSPTRDPKKPIVNTIEIASIKYRVRDWQEYPALARALLIILSEPGCVGPLEDYFARGGYGIEYMEEILSAITLTPFHTVRKVQRPQFMRYVDPSLENNFKLKQVSSGPTRLYEKYPDPAYYEAYKKYSEGRVKKMN